tara:strand:- start:361 stop:555 length:195 start_codon:yes stop_codon:yes gene_type:complete
MGQAAARGTFEQRKALAIKAKAKQSVDAVVDSIDASDAIVRNNRRGSGKSFGALAMALLVSNGL